MGNNILLLGWNRISRVSGWRNKKKNYICLEKFNFFFKLIGLIGKKCVFRSKMGFCIKFFWMMNEVDFGGVLNDKSIYGEL